MLEFGMPSDSPTCGPVATRRMQVLSTSARRGSYKPTIFFIKSKNEVAKATNLQSRCSVSALVSALVTSCVWNPVVQRHRAHGCPPIPSPMLPPRLPLQCSHQGSHYSAPTKAPTNAPTTMLPPRLPLQCSHQGPHQCSHQGAHQGATNAPTGAPTSRLPLQGPHQSPHQCCRRRRCCR